MLHILEQFPKIAQFICILAFIFGIFAFLSKDDIKLKFLAGIAGSNFALHFLLIGSHAGSIIALISAIRFFTSIKNNNKYLPLIGTSEKPII